MRLAFSSVILSSISGSYIQRFGTDPCDSLARSHFKNTVSSCDLYEEVCVGLFWASEARLTIKYQPEQVGLPSVKCSEAEAMNAERPSVLGKRKLRSEDSRPSLVVSSSSSVEALWRGALLGLVAVVLKIQIQANASFAIKLKAMLCRAFEIICASRQCSP